MGLILILFVFVIWVWLTLMLHWLVKKLVFAVVAFKTVRSSILFILTVSWLGVSFWYAGGRLYYYDWLVDRMCKVDGGVTVYETVLVSKEKYKDVIEGIVTSEKNTPTDEYYRDLDSYYYRTGQPDVWRNRYKVVRRSDGKILGESIFYLRRGGNFPGPWHESGYRCPKNAPGLTSLIFLKE